MSNRNFLALTALIVMFAIAVNFVCAQIPSEPRAVRAVERLGYSNVHVVNRSRAWGSFGGCKDYDVTLFTLRGTDPSGRSNAEIQVCAPIIGGYTVRG